MKNKLFFLVLFILSFSAFAEGGLFNSGLTFKDEDGKVFNLSSLQGKVVLMSMAYTSCQGSCPLIVSRLKKIEEFYHSKKIEPEIVIVTYDFEKDGPEVMKKYLREKLGVKSKKWHYLVGDDSSTRFISMALGIKYAKNKESGIIIHDNKVVAFGSDGIMTGRIESLSEPNELLMAKEQAQ